MSKKSSNAYDPKENENKIYEQWEKAGLFKPDAKKKKTYSIVIPPPNVTGELHMGHALNAFIQDILTRHKRMSGFQTLWIPGTDHAGIATQNVVEKKLKKQGLSRHDLGREKFLKEVWAWKKEYGNKILTQLKRLGASCDWSRTKFTMDSDYQEAVKTAFVKYYKKGWIYQGKRVINWCTRCQTSLSDLELEYKEEKGKLWYIKYGKITVATTRPETMLGDTAVAVNPKDERYKNLIGTKIILPLINREIPIIADRLIDIEFGTGAVKVTPAHSMVDAEIGLKHKLKIIQVIDERGKMTKEAKQYAGLNVLEAREKIIEELDKQNLIEKIEDYSHQIPHCYRCDRTVEPLLSQQWFVKMDELAKKAIKEVKSGKVKFHPKRWEKVYFDWLKNIRDWCISRQIWWGHQLPVWEHKGKYIVSLKKPKQGEQIPDVLDTWFSSALWPFATLGWPKKTTDLKKFYPTNTLSTARDIINLWVTRMIFSGLEFTNKKPFNDVIIHATILTKDGKRMSKSLGTGIDPIQLVEKYGADATRFGLIYQSLGGQDIHFSEENIAMGKKFANKIWNASKFVEMKSKSTKLPKKLTPADKKIIQQLNKTIKATNKELKEFRFGQTAHILYDFFWHDFCDTYIEESKNQKTNVLGYVLIDSLKLLHPFMPFVTESIYQKLSFKDNKYLTTASWPK
ncbi:valine--tRNA ligase [Patescibacteria group bacterium]